MAEIRQGLINTKEVKKNEQNIQVENELLIGIQKLLIWYMAPKMTASTISSANPKIPLHLRPKPLLSGPNGPHEVIPHYTYPSSPLRRPKHVSPPPFHMQSSDSLRFHHHDLDLVPVLVILVHGILF